MDGDVIFIHDLKITAQLGIHPWEKRVKQEISLDVEMGADIQKVSECEDLGLGVDYTAVAEQLVLLLEGRPFQLIETMGVCAADFILQTFPVTWVRLCLKKPWVIAKAREVGVRIERRR